jgi:hypothetical protein
MCLLTLRYHIYHKFNTKCSCIYYMDAYIHLDFHFMKTSVFVTSRQHVFKRCYTSMSLQTERDRRRYENVCDVVCFREAYCITNDCPVVAKVGERLTISKRATQTFHIVMWYVWLKTGFGLVNRFIDCLQAVIITLALIPQFTVHYSTRSSVLRLLLQIP